jgi:hypothetical protein
MKQKFNGAACLRSILRVQALFLKRAEECAGSQEWAYLVPTYRADARAAGRVAKLFKQKQYPEAFWAWQGLDSFPRDFFPKRTAKFMGKLAVTELKQSARELH